ncbi:MAG: nuclear transport factor 2 family protein [Alphaproteobacteria bacterium]|nr:nuclear transport factor 2 family protein [Alphaproteobacteria bacterium]
MNASVGDPARERAVLTELNRHYIRSVEQSDVAWFEANLANDFRCTTADGRLLDKAGFLSHTAAGAGVSGLLAHDVLIRLFRDFAIIHARTTYRKADGTAGSGRYTDDWQWRDGRWQCVSAHVGRS